MSDLEQDLRNRLFGQKADLEVMKATKLEMLDWFHKLLHSGSTVGMIRLAVHNKRVEITGEGERA